MITDYTYLNGCMGGFSAKYYQVSPEEYRESFLSGIQSGRLNKEILLLEIEQILVDDNISLRDLAEKHEAFFYDETKTEEDIMVMFQLLTWDILFPEKILSPEKLIALKSKVIELLKQGQETGNNSSHIDDLIWELEERDWSGLSRFDLLYMQREIGLPEIEMEYFVPELWFFELRSKPTPAT